jgi:hypothetical protein
MNIDELLSQPLAPVADNGFSAKVVARIRSQEQRQLVLISLVAVAVATVACLLLPVSALTELLNHIVITLATSLEVGVAVLAVLATWLYDRKFFRFWAS